jgi:hypothetical protein
VKAARGAVRVRMLMARIQGGGLGEAPGLEEGGGRDGDGIFVFG